MKTSMIARDAETFVGLARAVHLARAEGAIDAETANRLSAALVAGLLTGCMEMDTYARVHDALARLLEKTFEGPARPVARATAAAPQEENALEVYLQVVGEAWGKVSWEEEACRDLTSFVREAFDLDRAQFGEEAWFQAPLRTDASHLIPDARAAGLLVVSIEGAPPAGPALATLRDPDDRPGGPRVTLGWGDRRVALDLSATERG